MILSDREIRAAIRRDFVRIIPEPPAEAWSSTAVDLTLAPVLRRWTITSGRGLGVEFRPTDPDFDFFQISDDHTERIEIPENGYSFGPNSFILGWTVEKIRLPHHSRLAARVEGKSSV